MIKLFAWTFLFAAAFLLGFEAIRYMPLLLEIKAILYLLFSAALIFFYLRTVSRRGYLDDW